MAMIVAVAGQKGGTGKSTIAVCLAAEWHQRGRRVLLVDADPQGTVQTWAEVATDAGHVGPVVQSMGDNIRRDLPTLADAFEIVVIDCPGRAGGKRTAGALLVADVVLLPCGPAAPDVWALAASIDGVREAQALRPELRAAIVLNRSDRSAMTKGAREALADAEIPALARSLGSRVAFGEALAAGLGVTRYASGSVAANELRRLADEVEDLAGAHTENVDVA